MKVIVIAEAGVNHNGDMETALRLVDEAAHAGADFVKFQTFQAAELATADAAQAEYQKSAAGVVESQLEMLKRLELSHENHRLLMERCHAKGISFLSTAFDLTSLDFLASLGLAFYKIPSGEVTNLPYLKKVGSLGKPILLSTGMCGMGDIEGAIRVLEDAGAVRGQITVLQCNTQYPTPFADVNLKAMVSIGEAFGVKTGYSDHTLGIEAAVAATALGAVVIEKHFTLDRSLPGPDHKASLEPSELAAMVTSIRNVSSALGDGVKRPSRSEMANMPIARKSIVAAAAIRAGETFTESTLSCKRPGTGISPMRWNDVVGRAAKRDFQKDELIEL